MSEMTYESVVAALSEETRLEFPTERFHYVAETGSTNDDVLGLIREGRAQHLDLFVSDQQSCGRGRRGDRWEAAVGRNLLFSIALRLEEPKALWCRLPHLAAYVLGKTVESVLTNRGKLESKWPNDLHYEGRKIAGILVETLLVPEPFAVVGIGLNVNMRKEEFPRELQELATSLYEIESCESSRSFLLGDLVQGFSENYPDKLAAFDDVRAWLGKRDRLHGRSLEVVTSNGSLFGEGAGLGEDGELLLKTSDGSTQPILSAERVVLC